ncbi:MAG TPA: AarF/ABC1/UbiB kinase family protein [Euryarchaeota archaeon]|nr:AarF/ABC1/UbiB kinase family protein [Euryarchaeota archaeon]
MRVLMRYGFGSVVRKFEAVLPFGSKVFEPIAKGEDVSKPMRVRFILQELGPTAVKFGQWMSTRPDILPLEYISELEKLQDRVQPFPFEEVHAIIREELGGEIEEFFEYFSEEVIASGSIAQVHRANLMDGTSVAVKVQRPGIAKTIDTDMEILLDLSKLAGEHIIKTELYDPVAIVEEFAYAIERQLDFLSEARNVERFAKNFEAVDYVYVPKVMADLSSRRIITLEFIEGIKINDLDGLESTGLDNKEIAFNIASAYLQQVYIDGFFHGDPHPGNLFAMPRNVIGFTDFGIMGVLDETAKKYLTKSLVAIVNKDSRALAESMFDMGMVTGDVDFDSFSTDLDYMLRKYSGMSLNKVNFGEVLADILHLMNRHHTRMPPSLALLTMTLWSVEALVRNIDPDFNSFEASRPFVTEVIAKTLNPISRIKSIGRNAGEYYDLLDGFPRRIGRVMSKVEKGELKIMFQDEKLENLNIVMEKSSNRLILGAIVSTMILASSLLSLSGENPVFMGVAVLKALIVLGSLLGLWLVFTIVRSGKY